MMFRKSVRFSLVFVGNFVEENEEKKSAETAVGISSWDVFVVVSWKNSLGFVGKMRERNIRVFKSLSVLSVSGSRVFRVV